MKGERSSRGVPLISKALLYFFSRYANRFVKRHFHSVRLLTKGRPRIPPEMPLVIYLNHSAWWDPLICLLLARRFFPARNSYAPIDAQALRRYGFFRRLGFFGVEQGSVRGAREFLSQTSALLGSNASAVWLTPQGRFVDARVRPVDFQRGLGHLAARVERAAFIPLALEFTFWEERLPEVLLSFGAPLVFDAQPRLQAAAASQLFESALASVQGELAAAAQRRAPEEWDNLVSGEAGTARVYDLWRRTAAKVRGEKFRAAHSDL